MAEQNTLSELYNPDSESNSELAGIRASIKENTKIYIVKKGDTLAQIAKNAGLSYTDLADLNVLLGARLKLRGESGTTVIIKEGDKIYMPKDIKLFNASIEKIKEISRVLKMNRQVVSRDSKALKSTLDGAIFSKRVQSIGLPKVLDGFISAQKSQLDPRLPRIVDAGRETHVTCANLIRTLMGQSVNIGDLDPKEKAFLQKQNVDAWMLPTELEGIGYKQPISLMEYFDKDKIGQVDPIDDESKEDYEIRVSELGGYLASKGVKGSLVPLYFIHSNYKGRVAEYNRYRKDKHYNTHQTMFAGNTTITFKASEVGLVRNSILERFGSGKDELERRLKELQGEMRALGNSLQTMKTSLISALDPNINSELKRQLDIVKRAAYSFSGKRMDITEKIVSAIEKRDIGRAKTEISAILKYQISDEDVKYLMELENSKQKALEQIQSLKQALESSRYLGLDFEPGKILSQNMAFMRAFSPFIKKADKAFGLYQEIGSVSSEIQLIDKGEKDRVVEAENAKRDIVRLDTYLRGESLNIIKGTNILLRSIGIESNPVLKSKIDSYNNAILSGISPGNEQKRKRFLVSLLNDDRTLVEAGALTDEDFTYRRNLLLSIKKAENSIALLKKQIASGVESPKVISKEGLGKIVSENKMIMDAISQYNAFVFKAGYFSAELKANKELLLPSDSIPVISFLANFVQQRADIGSAYSPELRERIIEGLEKYPDLVKIKVDGKDIDIREELRKYRKGGDGSSVVKPTSNIEITGPLMIDGEHQFHSKDPERRAKMNARTRFFFEFIVSGLYLPTELLEPGPDSSFKKEGFGKFQDRLIIKGTYDVRRGDTVEKVLKQQIKVYEGLTPEDPNFQKKLNNYYALQIKALQIGGFLQDENTLNPGAFKINRVLPYYDVSNVSDLYKEYVAIKKEKYKDSSEKLSGLKEFVDIKTFPGDTRNHLFYRIKEGVENSKVKYEKYPNIRLLFELNEYQQALFMREFVKACMHSGKNFNPETFLSNIKPGRALVLSYSDLDGILGNINQMTHTKALPISPEDSYIIDFSVYSEQDRNILKSVLYIESYDGSKEKRFMSRKDVKKFLEGTPLVKSIGDYQIRIDAIANGWTEWITKENLSEFVKKIESEQFKAFIKNQNPHDKRIIVNDIKYVSELKVILARSDLTKDDFKEIRSILRKLLRLSSGDMGNTVGKILGSILVRDKVNIHFQKLNGLLTQAGENLDSIYLDKGKMSDYERAIVLINHMGENSSFYAFFENFILRIFGDAMNIEIDSKSVYDSSFKGKALGRVKYGKNTFLTHLEEYYNNAKGRISNPIDKAILDKIGQLCLKLRNTRNFNLELLIFLKDPELKNYLSQKKVNPSILPELGELQGGKFQKSVFNYLNKLSAKK